MVDSNSSKDLIDHIKICISQKDWESSASAAINAISKFPKSLDFKKKLILKAELFSVDGKYRYFYEHSDKIGKSLEIGSIVGNYLKKISQGKYKNWNAHFINSSITRFKRFNSKI